MTPKKWFVARGITYNTEIQPLSRLFDTYEDAMTFYKNLHREFETEYWICETIYS